MRLAPHCSRCVGTADRDRRNGQRAMEQHQTPGSRHFFAARRMPEAVVTNFVQPLGRHVLQKAAGELVTAQPDGAPSVRSAMLDLVAEGDAIVVETDNAALGYGHAKDVTDEIAQASPQAVQCATQRFDQVVSGTTRSGRRLDNAALSLPRTSLAKAANGTRKPARAGCHCWPPSDTPPPVRRQWTLGW